MEQRTLDGWGTVLSSAGSTMPVYDCYKALWNLHRNEFFRGL